MSGRKHESQDARGFEEGSAMHYPSKQDPSRQESSAEEVRGRFARIALGALGVWGAVLAGCHVTIELEEHDPRPAYWTRTEDERRELEQELSSMRDDEHSPGCVSCHEGVSDPHPTGTQTTCVSCHGGDGHARTIEEAHAQPSHPENWPTSGIPPRTYVLLDTENYEFIKFINPGDLRVAQETCGPCHDRGGLGRDDRIVLNVQKSIMTNASHFWGVAAYANGIVSNKRTIFGESVDANGTPQVVLTQPFPPAGETVEQAYQRGVMPLAAPLPQFEAGQTGNIFRVFETGSRLGGAALAFNGLPIPLIGLPDKFEDLGGRPNNKLSDRGLGTLNRVDLPLLNIFKTRLNDPFLSYMGTNDQPGDYRSSGCTACHVVYANNRDIIASGPYARFGNRGHGNFDEDPLRYISEERIEAFLGGRDEGELSAVESEQLADMRALQRTEIGADPALSHHGADEEQGHPIAHRFTQSIPSSQCMVCHHHQPNSFVNSYLGYTMWVYDSDGEPMFPEEERNPGIQEMYDILMRNPEEAALRGTWGYDWEFMAETARDVNPEMQHTQFADYHGHGWMFRGIFRMDRHGRLLDTNGEVIEGDYEHDAGDREATSKFAGLPADPAYGLAGTRDTAPLAFTADDIPAPHEIYPRDPETGEPMPEQGVFAPRPGRPVHMRDIHAERGMHCVDCHFQRDNHGIGEIYGEYQAAVEISCQDCHGSIVSDDLTDDILRPHPSARAGIASLYTSGPSTTARRDAETGELWIVDNDERDRRTKLEDKLLPFPGSRQTQFERDGDSVIQRSVIYEGLEWDVPQLATSENDRARAAHFWGGRDGTGYAHGDNKLECYTCHTSWITSCFGCHLPQQANWKTKHGHYAAVGVGSGRHDDEHGGDGHGGDSHGGDSHGSDSHGESGAHEGGGHGGAGHYDLRNFATYNPQVVRDSEFMLGIAGDVKENRIAPVRSSSAVLISSQDAQRQKIYGAVPTIGGNGMSSQLFNTHFPHTVRTNETKDCTDCHLSENGDNNAWMAQLFLLGTNTVGFMGHNVFVGEGEAGFSAVQATEWDEPQAVRGSNLHAMAYPDRYQEHLDNEGELQTAWKHYVPLNTLGRDIQSVQLRGEYLYTASGSDGFRVYDVANVNNKGFSQRVITAPFSPLGQDTHVGTRFATAVALPTNQHISMSREYRSGDEYTERVGDFGALPAIHRDNGEQEYRYDGESQNMHESYRYAYVSDLYEGMVVVDIDCLTDFDPSNNFVEKVLSFNPDGQLDGARHITVAGETAYVSCDAGVVAIDIDDPRNPEILATVGAPYIEGATSVDVQFRYAFVTDSEGLKVLDVTFPDEMRPAGDGSVSVEIGDARNVYVGKTYAYVAAGRNGLVVVDVERPEAPALYAPERIGRFNRENGVNDLFQVKIASTNDTMFAYLADGENGLKIAKIYEPNDALEAIEGVPGHGTFTGYSAYGWSPPPMPELVSWYSTRGPAKAISKALERDRAVDESGNQMTLFGFVGARPFNLREMQRFYLDENEEVFTVSPLLEAPQARAEDPREEGPRTAARRSPSRPQIRSEESANTPDPASTAGQE